jgi:hypothetical protein
MSPMSPIPRGSIILRVIKHTINQYVPHYSIQNNASQEKFLEGEVIKKKLNVFLIYYLRSYIFCSILKNHNNVNCQKGYNNSQVYYV